MIFKLIILVSSFLFLVSPAYAQHFVSPSYIIDWGNFNITSGKKTSTTYILTDTVGQNAPGAYTSNGFRVKSGFQYIYDTLTELTFVVDNLNINLGTLVAGVASTATNNITITTPSGHGYDIKVRQNHPLVLLSGTTIPDTSCNSNDCTVSASAVWTSSSAYGFGFNAIGQSGTSGYFTNSTYYRPFSSVTAQTIMSETMPVKQHSALITYKAVIPASQSAGNYQNAITFTAIAKY